MPRATGSIIIFGYRVFCHKQLKTLLHAMKLKCLKQQEQQQHRAAAIALPPGSLVTLDQAGYPPAR